MKQLLKICLSLFFIIAFSSACDEISENTNTKKNSQGAYGELILVMDSLQYAGALGEQVKKALKPAFPGLPQPEAYFNVRYIKPSKFEGLLLNSSTIVYVSTFDNSSKSSQKLQSYFTEESRKIIQEDPERYLFKREDEFARNQLVLHLFGETESELIENIRKNEQKIRDLIDNHERERIYKELYKGKEKSDLTKHLQSAYGYRLRVPFGYDMAKDTTDFVWLSQLGNNLFRNLIIAHKPYESEAQFEKDSIVAWRNSIGKNHLFGSGEKDTVSYMLTDEKYIEVQDRKVNFNEKFAQECRGLWKLKNNTRGGPFLCYVFVDEPSGELYYIEAFLYAPNKIKRQMMRELEAVLYSFRTPSELASNQ